MSATNPLSAADPQNNAIVKASAGVGKTYLLVTRLIRLLLQDVRPDSILAITFTRKAAAEMQSRLFDRLYLLATVDDDELNKELEAIGVTVDTSLQNKARQLYESLLRSEHQIKISTFHAFCQEVLRKFPLEADIPPGFELLDDEITFRAAAWEALYDEVTRDPESDIAKAMENLYELTGSLHSSHQSLDSFLNQRSDWWAYTQNQNDAAHYASRRLQQKLNIDPLQNPLDEFFHELNQERFKKLAELLSLHNTKANLKQVDLIHNVLSSGIFCKQNSPHNDQQKLFDQFYGLFYDSKGQVRVQKDNATRRKKMGEAGEQEFLNLFEELSRCYQKTLETSNKHFSFALSSACYIAGQRLCELYQKIKLEQRCLDFTDLEWKTYELLNHSENALWVQYKLDQRIDHFLVDEFQDTNPTQWRLIHPLLAEFSQDQDRQRSVFIVGDEKQSIYSFRRADPLLLNRASDWLCENLDAKVYPMDKSRRSAMPIMNLLNSFFMQEKLLPGFHEHSTFLQDMPGQITLLPLCEKQAQEQSEIYFRNSLETPIRDADKPHYREGQLIANTINDFVSATMIQDGKKLRPAHYGDIMILIRSRTHVGDYEAALREAGIPYQSNNKGTLFQCQEIQDLIALLDVLFTPYNNLALATVLRSPIFQCGNDSLLTLSRIGSHNNWFEHLMEFQNQKNCPQDLKHAANLLKNWQSLAGALPIHDMLNHIYHESQLLDCYNAHVPSHLKKRVAANLNRFLSLALEIDSGRYPSLGRFIARLHSLIQEDESPDEAQTGYSSQVVRILTIHASKGLESPVVFMADTADAKSRKNRSYTTLVMWPEHEKTPTDFQICPAKKNQDSLTHSLLEVLDKKQQVEDANLLYVALTRARQVLFVSGSSNNRNGNLGWYGLLEQHWPSETYENLLHTTSTETTTESSDSVILMENQQNLKLFTSEQRLDSENNVFSENEITAIQRGNIIHRTLEIICNAPDADEATLLIQLSSEFSLHTDHPELHLGVHEALSVFHHSSFQNYFNPKCYQQAFNEVKIQYLENEQLRQGIIDRLVLKNSAIYILDYKTHSDLELDQLKSVAISYRNQMRLYETAVKKIWPGKSFHSSIIFTHYLSEFLL